MLLIAKLAASNEIKSLKLSNAEEAQIMREIMRASSREEVAAALNNAYDVASNH